MKYEMHSNLRKLGIAVLLLWGANSYAFGKSPVGEFETDGTRLGTFATEDGDINQYLLVAKRSGNFGHGFRRGRGFRRGFSHRRHRFNGYNRHRFGHRGFQHRIFKGHKFGSSRFSHRSKKFSHH